MAVKSERWNTPGTGYIGTGVIAYHIQGNENRYFAAFKAFARYVLIVCGNPKLIFSRLC